MATNLSLAPMDLLSNAGLGLLVAGARGRRDKAATFTVPRVTAYLQFSMTVLGHGFETARCAGYAAILTPVAASGSRPFCSALI